MSKPNLDAIRARVEAATEGPWHIENDSEQDYEVGIPYSEWPSVLVGPENAFPSEWAKGHGETRRVQEVPELLPSDAEFISHARQDVPALLAYIEQLEAQLDAVRALVGPDNESGMVSASAIFHTIGTGNQ